MQHNVAYRFLFGVTVIIVPAIALSAGTVSSGQVQAAISIEQVSPSTLGEWVILSGETSVSSTDTKIDKTHYSFSLTSFGPTTITAEPPPGMSTAITVFRGGEQKVRTPLPQYSFNLLPNDNYRFLIQYSPALPSSLGITSEPSGVRFRLVGPTKKNFSGTTPADFKNLPAGKYSVTFGKKTGCLLPPVHSVILKPDQRNVVNIKFTCTSAEEATATRSSVNRRSIQQYVEERELKPAGQKK